MSPAGPVASAISRLLAECGRDARLAVAFSGGLDSTVLAHALRARRQQLGELRLLHVDHGLQVASATFRRHCEHIAREWQVAFVALPASIEMKAGASVEAAARDARYALFEKELRPGELLVTAHHQDDQAETLLLQLFRGAGVAGLAAMPARARFAQGHLLRPFLDVTRAELTDYARAHRLQWVDDPTNVEDRYGRNFLRLRVMPLLRERWTGVDSAIARSARHMAEAMGLLDSQAHKDLIHVADGDGLNVAALRRLTAARQRNVLRSFIARAGRELPSAAQLKEISGLLLTRADAQPEVRWPGGSVRRRAGRLQLHAGEVVPDVQSAPKSWHWRRERELVLNDAGDRLALVDDANGPVDLAKLPGVLWLRPRKGGETLRPGPRARAQAVKKLLQAARISLEERARLPLLFAGDGADGPLIAVGDRWLDASVHATVKSRRRARLVWIRNV